MSIELTALQNGFRVITEVKPGTGTAAVGVFVNVGARQEDEATNGLAHLVEHMLFKGTKTRTARQISEMAENVGANLNAFTSREQTAYHVKCLAADVPLCVELLADMLGNSLLDATELDRERTVILQELQQVEDTPDELVFDLAQETAFPSQPMGLPILGNPERIKTLPPAALQAWLDAHYVAENMALVAVGDIDPKAIQQLAERYFQSWRQRPATALTPASYQGGEVRRQHAGEQLQIVLQWPSVAFTDPAYYAVNVLTTLLGGGMSSRLFQAAREERGLCYSIYAYSQHFADSGVITIYAGTAPEQGPELLQVVASELRQLVSTINEAEFNRAKAQLKASLLMGMESNLARAEHLAQMWFSFGRIHPVEELLAEIDAVRASDVAAMAAELLGTPISYTILGQVANQPSRADFIKQLKE